MDRTFWFVDLLPLLQNLEFDSNEWGHSLLSFIEAEEDPWFKTSCPLLEVTVVRMLKNFHYALHLSTAMTPYHTFHIVLC